MNRVIEREKKQKGGSIKSGQFGIDSQTSNFCDVDGSKKKELNCEGSAAPAQSTALSSSPRD